MLSFDSQQLIDAEQACLACKQVTKAHHACIVMMVHAEGVKFDGRIQIVEMNNGQTA
jgi:hypothetical protein